MGDRTSRTRTDLEAKPPPATDGLGRLDRDRALSLADEGGMSASGVESQDLRADDRRAARVLAIFTLAVVTLWSLQQAFRRQRRRRG